MYIYISLGNTFCFYKHSYTFKIIKRDKMYSSVNNFKMCLIMI